MNKHQSWWRDIWYEGRLRIWRPQLLLTISGLGAAFIGFYTSLSPEDITGFPWAWLLLLGAFIGLLATQVLLTTRTRASTNELQQLNNELKATHRYLRNLIDWVPDPIFFKNRQHQWIDGNKAFWDFMGDSPEKFLGKSDYEFFPKEEADVFWEKDNEVFASDTAIINEEYFTDHQGQRHVLSTKKIAVTNEKGEEVLAGIIRDITQLKQNEEALRESERRFQLAVEGTRDGIWDWTNARGDEVYWSPQLKKLLGYRDDELKGSIEIFFNQIIHPDDAERTRRALQESVQNKVPYDIEYRLQTKSGEYRWFMAKGKVYATADQTVVRMTGSITDIHERKLLEYEREMLIEKLARSNEEMERFAYVASHDLQEPLRMVASFTQLLDQRYGDQLDERAREYLAITRESATRMQQMVADLLEYARFSRDNAANDSVVDTQVVLNEVIKNLGAPIEESSAIITYDAMPVVACNPVNLSSLLQNLIGNAMKYQQSGKTPAIHIGAEEKPMFWVFSVQDNGIGIKQEYFERIFYPFKRLHTTQQYSGTGMGLAICKKVIENLGGKLWLESTPGEGSIFYFSIPKIKVEALHDAA